MAKKATGGKKKGPKGKKARAKAKLDRQWGEELTEEQLKEARNHRRGTGSVKQKDASKRQPTIQTNVVATSTIPTGLPMVTRRARNHEELLEDDDDDDDDDDEQENSGNALNSLLQAIQKNSSHRKMAGDDDGMSDDDDVRKAQLADPEEEEEEDEEDIVGTEQICDLFGRHFHRTEVPETGKSHSAETMVKVTAAPLDDSIEVHLSALLFADLKASGLSEYKDSAAAATTSEKELLSSEVNWRRLTTKSFTGVRKALSRAWQQSNEARRKVASSSSSSSKAIMSPLQRVVFPCLTRYADILMTAESPQNREQMASVLRLHVLNHVLTSRGRIQRHNQRLRELAKATTTAGDETELLLAREKCRDQGYTRPTVLVLLPTRGTCYAFVQGMLRLLGQSRGNNAGSGGSGHANDDDNDDVVDQWDRFEAEFGAPPSQEGEDQGAEQRRRKVLARKGQEWLELFGDDVNDDDDFKIGISLTPKAAAHKGKGEGRTNSNTSASNNSSNTNNPTINNDEYTNVYMKLFADFYKSDIILASPLALKLLSTTSDSDDADYDFLSSIEICILSRMDVLLMQNMDHVTSVMALLNQQPKQNTHDIDFSRVRDYCLAGHAALWRQLIVCSNIVDPQIVSLFKRHAKSWEGSVKIKCTVTSMNSSIAQVAVVMPMTTMTQVFQRVSCSSLADHGSAKVKYLVDKLLPTLRQQKHTMIFIPSYFDYVMLRNILLQLQVVNFASVTEYSRVSEVTRSRARFLQGRQPLLLYTGRAHYFHRHAIKGVRHLVFLGLPEHADFYVDLVQGMGDGLSLLEQKADEQADSATLDGGSGRMMTCLALFTKYEAHALERIAGREDCRKMLASDKTAFAFTSGY